MTTNMETVSGVTNIGINLAQMIASVLARLFSEKEVLDRREEAMMRCAEKLAKGGEASYKLFSNEDAKKIENLLLNEEVDFLSIARGTNETMIVIGKEDEGKFLEIMENFRYMDMDYYKDLNEKELLTSIEKNFQSVPKLYYRTQEAASLAAEKLYASKMSFAMEQNPDGTYEIILHPLNMYKEGPGSDFTMFEVLMAYEQSKNSPILGVGNDWQNMRLEQAAYDEGRMEEFARRAALGEDVVLSDLSPYKESNFYIEARHGEITINERNPEGEWEQKTFRMDGERATPDEIKKMCSRYTEQIHDMGVTDSKTYEEHYKGKIPSQDFRTKENIRPVFDNGVMERFGTEELKPLLMSLQKAAGREARKKFSKINHTDLSQVSEALSFQRSYVVDKLKDPNDALVAEFLTKNTPGFPNGMKRAWLEDIADQLLGKGRHTDLDTDKTVVSVKEQQKRADKRQKEKEEEFEKEQKEHDNDQDRGD